MPSFFIFTAKEITEQIRTFKGVVILAVMAVFGMSSPLFAKLTPEIVKLAGAGISIRIPEPTVLDAFAQFFKNVGQMGLIVVLLLDCASIASEVSKGTAGLILTKRLSRGSFVLAKLLACIVTWTVSYAFSCLLFCVYTRYLFPGGGAKISHFAENAAVSFFSMWLFGIVSIAIAIFASSFLRSYALSAVAAFCLWGLTMATAAVPRVKEITPARLATDNVQLIAGSTALRSFWPPILAGTLLAVLLAALACLFFRRREL